ncbi:hypothetical protein DYB30_004644 [Aphanomyces astaci]|uniref:tRNA(Ile)-lysidine synthetase n=2 Tax=Aphanomyces astaci TaxID=112090 RepID=A0A397CDS8_APHAT|nr:hypothetical protein DYB30_004644 [Aphanomyces astaci]
MAGNEGGEATTAEEVLSYWFDGDMQELHRTKWFPVSGSDVQAATDADITSRFGTLLATAETRALHASWTSRPHSFVALIVLLDQFCRHVYRHDADKRKAIDVLALELATQFVDAGLHLHVSVPHFVFALMPFRHSPTPDRLEHVLAHIDGRETTMLHDTDLLSKFRRTTVQRQSHLRVPNHREPGEEFDILERAAFLHPNEALLLPKHPLVPIMHAFLTSMRAGSDACPAIGISLSGGVDSMVIAYLLVTLAPRYNNFKVVAVHIDYLNRPESSAEAAYVRAWAHDHNIECIVRPVEECQRATTKREDYEKLSRDIRYTTYQDVMARFTIPGMCVGHHRGDVQENVISNMMKGQSLLGLNGMTPSSMVNGVRIWRPLLAVNKDAIFDFAHTFGVPYFKDTTPQWSTRGKLRRQLMPLLQNIYGDVLKPNFKASWITLKKQTKSFVTNQKHLVLFREPVFQTVFPPDLYFVAETTPLSTVGPWRIQLRLVASPHTDTQILEVITYVLPHAHRYILDTEDRPAALRGIDKCLTDAMPLLKNHGVLQDSTHVVVVTYSQRYTGLEAYGKAGMSKLQQIIDTATAVQHACRSANDLGVTIGVAVLSSSGRVYTSSSNDLCLDTCPERLAFMKLASDECDYVVEVSKALLRGAAISSSDGVFTPYPCGSCREFLSQFGDFPLYLIRATMEFEQTTAYALFPRGSLSALPGATNKNDSSSSISLRVKHKETLQPRHLLHPKDWAVAHAVDWLIEDVEAWIQSRSSQASVTFPEFALAFCHTWTANTRSLPVPKVDLATVRGAFDRMDTNGNGSLDKAEVAQALAALGQPNPEDEAAKWFAQVDADGSNSLSFPEFLVRYAELQWNLAPLHACFDAMAGSGSHVVDVAALPQLFRSLQVLYDRSKLDKWTDARLSSEMSFADFCLAYFLFVQAPAPMDSVEDQHRHRIVQLQQSGHVRLCTRPPFQIGDRVVDKTRSMGAGTIVRLSGPYQVCTVHFDSGIKRHNVAMASLRRFKPAPLAAFRVKAEPFQVDARTKAIRRGRVTRVRSNDEYDVVYSDGEVEKHVPVKHMSAWEEGMQVEARGSDSPTYYRGEIVLCRTNDTFDIKFRNGAEEDKVPRKWIRVYSGKDTSSKSDKKPTHHKTFEVLDVVEAKFGGKGAYFRGHVTKCRSGGTYDIQYDDGDVEKDVGATHMRFVSLENVAKGEAVEARFGGKEAFYPGTISRVHGDGSVDVEYADGDRETRVPSRYVRLTSSGTKKKADPSVLFLSSIEGV